MKRTLAAAGIAVMALIGIAGCHHWKPCPHDASVYYTPGC